MSPMKLTQHVQWDQRVATKVIVVEKVDVDTVVQWVERQPQLERFHFQQHQLHNKNFM
jgi:hypothetical protein